MKNVFITLTAWIAIANVASAVVVPRWERPIMRAQLSLVDGSFFPRAMSLTLNQRDESSQPTSFTLVEDTGIRCIMAPCPSRKVTQFEIQEVSHAFHNSDIIQYEAVEILRFVPKNVRIAPRRLNVTQTSMELVAPGGDGFMRRNQWEVEISNFFGKPQMYEGTPEPVFTVADIQ